MHAVELHGEQVRLREFHMDDVDAAFAVVGDGQVTRLVVLRQQNSHTDFSDAG